MNDTTQKHKRYMFMKWFHSYLEKLSAVAPPTGHQRVGEKHEHWLFSL
ncbi:hypothetical protein [Pradoshia sp. D12]|nr:hypothetical protein [Pradoshia sp. D12]